MNKIVFAGDPWAVEPGPAYPMDLVQYAQALLDQEAYEIQRENEEERARYEAALHDHDHDWRTR